MSKLSETAKFGLKEQYLKEIKKVLDGHPNVKKAVIFGSRAKGNYRRGSDVDIALYGDLDLNQISHIEYELNEETRIPLFFDVVGFQLLNSVALKEHIASVGKMLGG